MTDPKQKIHKKRRIYMREQSSGGGGSNQLLSKHYCSDEVAKTIKEAKNQLKL